MYAMEDADTPSSDPLNQYNWLHLSHLTTFALCCSHATFAELLSMLKIQLNNYQYRKGRGELMWLVLQYVAFATGSSTFNDDSISRPTSNVFALKITLFQFTTSSTFSIRTSCKWSCATRNL